MPNQDNAVCQRYTDKHTTNGLRFWCPACRGAHELNLDQSHRPAWTWNDDLVSPTITPSVNVTSRDEEDNNRLVYCCHSFVSGGRIQYLDDCTHKMAGQTVDLPAYPKK